MDIFGQNQRTSVDGVATKSSSSSSAPQHGVNKIFAWVVLVIILVVVLIGAGFFYQYFGTGGGFGLYEKSVPTTSVSALALAETSLSFLEGTALQADKRGTADFWVPRFECNSKKCLIDRDFSREGYVLSSITPPAEYVRTLRLFAQKTGEAEYTKKADLESLFILNACRYDADICRRGFSSFVETAVRADRVADLSPLLDGDRDRIPRTLMGWFQRVERFFLLAGATGSSEDRAAARTILDEGPQLSQERYGARIYKEGGFEAYAGSCWGPLAAMRAYEITRDASYLSDAQSFVARARLGDHAEDLYSTEAMQGQFLTAGLNCADLLVSLWEATDDDTYLDEALKILRYGAYHNVDHPKHIVVNGDGAFTRVYDADRIWKHSFDTLWFVNVLLRVPKETTFDIPLSL